MTKKKDPFRPVKKRPSELPWWKRPGKVGEEVKSFRSFVAEQGGDPDKVARDLRKRGKTGKWGT